MKILPYICIINKKYNMSELLSSLKYGEKSDKYNNDELIKIICDYYKKNVSNLHEMNSFAASLSTYSSFVYDDLRALYTYIICACCNKYGDDKGTIKAICLWHGPHCINLIYPNDMFISDVSLIKYDDGTKLHTVYELAVLADDLISKYDINVEMVISHISNHINDSISKDVIKSIINELK